MKLGFAFLADAAIMQPDGTFAVIGGGFDLVKSKRFPAQKPVMVVVARLDFDQAEYGNKCAFTCEIVDHEGKQIFPPMDGEFTPTPHPWHPERGSWITVCLNAVGVEFPMPGSYAVRIAVNEKPVGEVPIEVIREEEPK